MTVSPDPATPPSDVQSLLARGEQLFNSQKYFDAHEVWEDLWRVTQPPDKLFIQGLVQIAAAMHHYSRDNRVGAQSLSQRGLQNLSACPDEFRQLDIESFRRDVRCALDELRSHSTVTPFQICRK